MRTLSTTDLSFVLGALSRAQLGKQAVAYAEKMLRTGPVFLGDVTNSTPKQPVFNRQGVKVSTGDEADIQFGVWRALRKAGKFVGLKDL